MLIDAEGVQHSSFRFSTAQQCLTFLACLEGGLAPSYRLDPPLPYQKGRGENVIPQNNCGTRNVTFAGKMLPRLMKRKEQLRRQRGCESSVDTPASTRRHSTTDGVEEEEAEAVRGEEEFSTDYVFRIVPGENRHQQQNRTISNSTLSSLDSKKGSLEKQENSRRMDEYSPSAEG